MKFTIFSPIVERSAIGRMMALVNRSLLTAGHEVIVVRTEENDDGGPVHEVWAPIISWSDSTAVVEAAMWADVVVYHVGNHLPLHLGCLQWIPQCPGVVCLHDYFVGSMYLGWCHLHGLDAVAGLTPIYGADVASKFLELMGRGEITPELVDTAPATEWICRSALGVVVHSAWMIDRVVASCPGPIGVIPLAYNTPWVDRIERHRGADSQTRLLTVGHVNANKRIRNVISAIAASPRLRAEVVYHVVGRAEPTVVVELARHARDNDVHLVVVGEVDQQTLAQEFHAADIVVSVRSPHLESASATAIEAMLSERVVVVSSSGPARDVPDDCVVKINMDDEHTELLAALERLVFDPVEREAIAQRGFEYAQQVNHPDRYAEGLVEFSLASLQVAPSLGVLDQMRAMLTEWGDDGLGDDFVFPLILEVLIPESTGR